MCTIMLIRFQEIVSDYIHAHLAMYRWMSCVHKFLYPHICTLHGSKGVPMQFLEYNNIILLS